MLHIRKYRFAIDWGRARGSGASACGLADVDVGAAEEGDCQACVAALSEATRRWLAARLFGAWLAGALGAA